MKLKDKIVSIKPRELAGPRTGKKFDYQTHWSICKVLDLHMSNIDYLVVMEYHDDVLILDSPNNPARISFYQLKTKESTKEVPRWKLNTLKAIPTRQKNSIIGKLFINYQNFKDNVDKLCFVSNASFSFDLEHEENSELKKLIVCSELSTKSLLDLKNALKNEFSLSQKPQIDDLLNFEVSELIPDKQEELTRNYISQFIEKNFPGRNYTISPIYTALFGEFTRKRNFDKVISTYDEFLSKKGLSKSDINNILLVISQQENSFKDLETRISMDLKMEGESVGTIRNFTKNWRRLEVSLIGHDKAIFDMVQKKIKTIINDLEEKNILETKLMACKVQVLESYQNSPVRQNSIDEELIEMLILKEIYGN